MRDRDAAFFDELGRLGHVTSLDTVAGTVRFDISDGLRTDHWLITINHGAVGVSPSDGDADCVIHVDEASFRRLADGRTVPFAAFLSNEIGLDGSFALLILVGHLFPGPADAHDPREFVEHDRRRS
jgi:hypothetical protein